MRTLMNEGPGVARETLVLEGQRATNISIGSLIDEQGSELLKS